MTTSPPEARVLYSVMGDSTTRTSRLPNCVTGAQLLEAIGKFPVRLQVSLDFQYAPNPGFNADRGRVRFYAIRVHVEY